MTNPNNAVGTNGAYGGRTSVNALNDSLGAFSSRGIVSGWKCIPSTGMTVVVGGTSGIRDVAVAQDNIGNKTTINNISAAPISVTISAAPATNKRIDLIVAYVSNPPQGSSTVVDNPAACGLIVVTGTAAATPTAPNDSAIRTAITADGATGTNAYYVIIAQIQVNAGISSITSNYITTGDNAVVKFSSLDLSPLKQYASQNTGTAWTIPSSGLYSVMAQAAAYNELHGLYIQIQSSGSTTWETVSQAYTDNTTSWVSESCNWVGRLNAGDKVRVCCPVTGTIMTQNGQYNKMFVFRIA